MKKKYTICIGIVVIIILIGAFFWFSYRKENKDGLIPNSVNDNTNANTGINPIVEPNIPQPNLDRDIVFPNNFPEDAQKIIRDNIETLSVKLKANSQDFESWVFYGNQWNIIGDYEGARDAWEYASALSPSNQASFFNLGDLYHLRLKDFSASEENFLQAIQNGPNNILAYTGLHSLYTLSYTEKSHLADDILLDGLVANPDDATLLFTLARYYKDIGNTEDARTYFQKLLDVAKQAGDDDLVTRIETELQAPQ